MTPREHAAFRAGLRHAAEMALIAAITLEIRPDAADLRQRAAIEALCGLADGLKLEAGNFAVLSQYLLRAELETPSSLEAATV